MEIDSSNAHLIFDDLNKELEKREMGKINLLVGGGGSLIIAHNFMGSTADIDAHVLGAHSIEELREIIDTIAQKRGLSSDWMNDHFKTFTVNIPHDYKSRIKTVYSGENLTVDCLGLEDILVMKLLAGRPKDTSHIRYILSQGVNMEIVEEALERVRKARPELVEAAYDLLDSFEE